MTNGKLVVLAGGEGCGKSTCCRYLQNELSDKLFEFTREPGGTSKAEKVRDFFLNNELTAYEELLSVELARSIHFREKIIPTLKSGKHVICDRCSEASWAYQIVAKNKNAELGHFFNLLDNRSRNGVNVDLWIDFKIDVKTALKRRMNDTSEINLFDSRPIDYHIKVREGLDQYFKQRATRVFEVDATLSKKEVAKIVHCKIISFLNE